jgi:hypothetical protein
MPTTKSLIARIRIIDSCFTSKVKRYWSIEELMEKMSSKDIDVARRTIEEDLNMMRYDDRLRFHAPIAYCKRNKGHYYKDEKYSIQQVISPHDVEYISFLVQALGDYWIKQVAPKKKAIDDAVRTMDSTMEVIKKRVNEIVDRLRDAGTPGGV